MVWLLINVATRYGTRKNIDTREGKWEKLGKEQEETIYLHMENE